MATIFPSSLLAGLLTTMIVGLAGAPLAQAAPAKQKDNYNYLGYGGLEGNANSGATYEKKRLSKKTAPRKSKSGRILVDPKAPLSDTANSELTVPTDEKSLGELPTPATVRSKVGAVSNPVTRPSFEVGLGVSQFAPAGQIKLPGLDAYDLSALGSRPMVHLQVTWFPIRTKTAQPLSFGPLVELSYAQHAVSLVTPTGASIEGTQLHSMAGQLGARLAWQPSFGSPWEAHSQVALGQFNSTQSSGSSFANHSASESFASVGLFGQRRLWEGLGVFVGYEHRFPVRGEPEEIVLQRSNVLAGLSGGFQ